MTFNFSLISDDLRAGTLEIAQAYGIKQGNDVTITTFYSDVLTVEVLSDQVKIGYSKKHEFFRGLLKAFNGKSCSEKSKFSHLTYMNDCSRCAVPTVDTVKRLVRTLAVCGYDRIQLYTEDVYKIENRPMFGYLRGAYTQAELNEIDNYAKNFGIELVPCIQTLGHLDNIFRWKEFRCVNDHENILLCDSEETYGLIEDMFSQLERSFSSRLVHIGMDEARKLGLGSYLDKHGYQDRTDVFLRHLNRVAQIAKKHGFTCQMWSDMFFRLAYGGDYYNSKTGKIDVDAIIPDNVQLVYWDYYHTNKEHYDKMIGLHKNISQDICFAGGAWKWVGFAPINHFTLITAKIALDSCIEQGVNDVTLTSWGDNGGEASHFSTLPGIVYYAERSYDGEFNENFQMISGCSLDDFMLLDLANVIDEKPRDGYKTNFCKIFLYSDVILGLHDDCAKPQTEKVFRSSLQKLKDALPRSGGYRALFQTQIDLLEVLIIKYDVGNKIRKAYLDGDKQTLIVLCTTLDEIEQKLKIFHKTFSKQWYLENKPFGMEIHDGRLGWTIQRVICAKERISQYLNGEIERLPELEEKRVLTHDLSGIEYFEPVWSSIVTSNKV